MKSKEMENNRKVIWISAAVLLLAVIIVVSLLAKEDSTNMTFADFKSLSAEQQIDVFNRMTGPEIYSRE
jgi:anaerobic C4-dicarboxylate transporter